MSSASQSGSVLIQGDGIAAVCLARLLSDAGLDYNLEHQPRPKVASVLLSRQSELLLRSIFPETPEHGLDLFDGYARITTRIVRWGEASDEVALPHHGIVVPEGDLLKRLWSRVPNPARHSGLGLFPPWICSTHSGAAIGPEYVCGSRIARFAQVRLSPQAEASSCWIESVPAGWLFLLADGMGNGTLIAVGDQVDALLATSNTVARRLANVTTAGATASVAPLKRERFFRGHMLACGGAAMRFDPLCGEGAGHAAREAFLAAAVLIGMARGESEARLLEHYKTRLDHAFYRHLQLCFQFYSTGGTGEFWSAQASALRAGLIHLGQNLPQIASSRYRLIDRDLVPF